MASRHGHDDARNSPGYAFPRGTVGTSSEKDRDDTGNGRDQPPLCERGLKGRKITAPGNATDGTPCKGMTIADPEPGDCFGNDEGIGPCPCRNPVCVRRIPVLPFQGGGKSRNSFIPRALPWARILCPLRGVRLG